jgi:hypothetical protein
METDIKVEPLAVAVYLYHITYPDCDYWTSYCPTLRNHQKVVLTNSDRDLEALKRKVIAELTLLDQTPCFHGDMKPDGTQISNNKTQRTHK